MWIVYLAVGVVGIVFGVFSLLSLETEAYMADHHPDIIDDTVEEPAQQGFRQAGSCPVPNQTEVCPKG
jgi:hypothetical protein